jgi:hypothetical protein
MLFFYMVIQVKNGIKDKPVMMDEIQLQETIEQ